MKQVIKHLFSSDGPYWLLYYVVVISPLKWVIPDDLFLRIQYRVACGERLNLKNPRTFNEKLQWLKINDRRLVYSKMVDKCEAKSIVGQILGEECIIPTIAICNKVEDIEWDALPKQFVIKCTHDSGGLIICKDKDNFDKKYAVNHLRKAMHNNYYIKSREWPYKNVKPRLIIEQYMQCNQGELYDYKFFCFSGKVKFFKIDFGRFVEHHANYYDINGQLLPFEEVEYPKKEKVDLQMPSQLKKMITMAERLSLGIPFLRVDFYEVNNRVYFGEMTFYPASGMGHIEPKEWNYIIGDYIDLSLLNYE